MKSYLKQPIDNFKNVILNVVKSSRDKPFLEISSDILNSIQLHYNGHKEVDKATKQMSGIYLHQRKS